MYDIGTYRKFFSRYKEANLKKCNVESEKTSEVFFFFFSYYPYEIALVRKNDFKSFK